MASWIDDFEGNKLNRKWVATRFSVGGQNNGAYTATVSDSKLRLAAIGAGTESDYWGVIHTLPVNAVGDIIVDAQIRAKLLGGSAFGRFGVALNQPTVCYAQYGGEIGQPGAGANYLIGHNGGTAGTRLPGFPSKAFLGPLGIDDIAHIRLVRKNNYLAIFINNTLIGMNAYPAAVTNVGIVASWYAGTYQNEGWIDWLRITPSSVVL